MQNVWKELQSYLTVQTTTSFASGQSSRPVSLTFTVTNSATSRPPQGPEIVFEDVKLYIRTESDGEVFEVLKELGRLGPQELSEAAHQVSYGDLIWLTHRLEGRVSPETFFTVTLEGSLRQQDVNLPVEGYISVLDKTNLNKWLDDTLKGFLVPGPDTTLGDLKEQSQALSEATGEIRETKERLQKLSSLVARDKNHEAAVNHSKQAVTYLDGVDRAIGELRQVLESRHTERLKGTLDHLVSRLEQSAMKLGNATEELKHEIPTTSRSTQGGTQAHTPAIPWSTGRDDSSPSDDDYSGETSTPNDDRSDSLNPNNPDHQASIDNRSDQLNPNNPAYHSSRGGKGR